MKYLILIFFIIILILFIKNKIRECFLIYTSAESRGYYTDSTLKKKKDVKKLKIYPNLNKIPIYNKNEYIQNKNNIFNIPKYKIKTYKIKDENDKIRYIKMKCPIK